eukprot:gnl/Hemi2/23740_TR7971_c0_g9_i1.p1 gnl/Hemi2/23740_TR7971_c0_g9~~gnl/Hemi2/23740_TR7971_c0_g9_i1.p1  ORF type:complete len:293 (+),score=61.21 gnl/Hemi2/23740_TR7971_c0_g9_i1:88-966(+)
MADRCDKRGSSRAAAFYYAVVVLLALTGGCLALRSKTEQIPQPWTYESQSWGGICDTGYMQSPIDIPLSTGAAAELHPLYCNYRSSNIHVRNDGYAIALQYAPGSTLKVARSDGTGKMFYLHEIRFHSPSEHTIGGAQYPLEAHLVHSDHPQDSGGAVAIVSVLFQDAGTGYSNSFLNKFWWMVSSLQDVGDRDDPNEQEVTAMDLLPDNLSYFMYSGSLTSPPCTEGIDRYVMRHPAKIGTDQLTAFRRIYNANFRALQPTNNRRITLFDDFFAKQLPGSASGSQSTCSQQ